jgi:RimJ/RimL family protein N-acetyltransferase
MASLGYWIGDEHQQQGFGKEALAALIEWSFAQLKLTRLEIICDPSNIPSQQLAQACEAKQECLAQNRFIFHGQPKAGLVFSIIPEPI